MKKKMFITLVAIYIVICIISFSYSAYSDKSSAQVPVMVQSQDANFRR